VVGDEAPRDDPAVHLAPAVHPLDGELDHAVVHPDLIPGPEHGEVLGMADRSAPGRPLYRRSRQHELLTGDECRLAALEGAEPDLQPLQILEYRDGPAPVGLPFAD